MSGTPTLGELFNRSISTALASVNTAIPARVVAFDGPSRKVDVQPLINKRLADGRSLEYPTILQVPVVYPASSKAMFYFPLEKGDPVLLVIAQSSLDNWVFSNSGKPTDPDDARRFDITDAVAIPCAFPFPLATTIWDSQTLTSDQTSVIIKHNIGTPLEAQVTIQADGKIALESQVQVNVTSPLTAVNGDLFVTGDITTISGTISSVLGDVTAGTVSLNSHTHSGVTSGPAVSGPPVP